MVNRRDKQLTSAAERGEEMQAKAETVLPKSKEIRTAVAETAHTQEAGAADEAQKQGMLTPKPSQQKQHSSKVSIRTCKLANWCEGSGVWNRIPNVFVCNRVSTHSSSSSAWEQRIKNDAGTQLLSHTSFEPAQTSFTL